eukprot:s4001_g8.t1
MAKIRASANAREQHEEGGSLTFDPSSLPFELTWGNFGKLKSHYKLSDADTTAILIATCGPSEEGKRYWERYRVSTSEPKPASTSCPDKSPLESDGGEESRKVAKAPSMKTLENAESLKKLKINTEHGDGRKSKAAKTSRTDEPMVEPEKPAPKTHNGRRIVKVHPDTQHPSDYESEYKYEDPEEEDVEDDDEHPVTDKEDASDEDDILSTCKSRGSDDHPPPAPPRASQVPEAEETVAMELEETRSEPVKQPIDEAALDAKYALKESLKSVATPAKAETWLLYVFCDSLSCETLVLGQQEVSRQASDLNGTASPEDGKSDLASELGPSASRMGHDSPEISAQKASELLQCLTKLQDMATDPAVQQVLDGLSSQFPTILRPTHEREEVQAARDGAPSSSRPASRTAAKPLEPKKVEETETENDKVKTKTEPKPEPTTVKKEAEDAPPGDAAAPNSEIVNSSTHRKEHARLNRRMASTDAATHPEMVRLWQGNRSVGGLKNVGIQRKKIDSILRRGDGLPDPDAPDCPESVRFWCWTSGKYQEKEKLSLTGTSSIAVKPSKEGVASLVDSDNMPASGGGLSVGSGGGSGSISLQSLVGVMNDTHANKTNNGGNTARAKGKAKAKAAAKAKAVEPQTAKEKRETGRSCA